MPRIAAFITALLLVALGVVGAPTASAAPLPADYAAGAAATVLTFDLDIGDGLDLNHVNLMTTRSLSGSTLTPRSGSAARNLAFAVDGLELDVNSNQQIAPPDPGGPATETMAAANVSGLLSVGALDTSVEAHYATDASCVTGDLLADSHIDSTAGVSVEPSDLPSVLTTGSVSTSSIGELIPTTGFNRAVRATASGTLPDASFLGGEVGVTVDGGSDLIATANGVDGGATLDYNPGTVTVTEGGTDTVLPPGTSQTFEVASGSVTFTVNLLADMHEEANGKSAWGSVAVLTADVRVGPVSAPLATARVDLLPLQVAAIAPAGGIDCPPPALSLVDPADGSATEDRTPTYAGRGWPGASINLTIDDETLDDVVDVDEDGNWGFTPATPLALGDHAASATQTVDGESSVRSNENTFSVVDLTPPAPVITEPIDNSTTADSSPDIVGTGELGATVTVSIDGTEIGDAVVDEDGNWTVPVTTPLADGPHAASAIQTDEASNESAADEIDFVVEDTVAPDAPVIAAPTEGSTTGSTPDIAGTGERLASVTVSIDGTEIGDAMVDGDGNWTVPVTTPLADGPHTVSATQTDEAGNESAADEVDLVVEDTAAPDAPEITAPADGSTIPEPTPNVVGTGEPFATVAVSIDGTEIGSGDVDQDGNWSVPVTTPLADGPHTASAIQTDEAGNASDADESEFVVDDEAPDAPVITAPAEGSTTTDSTPDVVGTGEPGATVTVSIDAVLVGDGEVDEDGNWTVPVTTPLADGLHSVSAVLADSAGNESEVTFADFTVAAPDGEETDTENAVDNGPGSGGQNPLANTGGPAVGVSILGLLCLVAGGALVLTRSRRRNTTR